MNDFISVIMSSKDTDEKMLRESIESILNQTYRNFEFLIMCDGSESDYNIVSSYKDERIRVFKHDVSKGLPASLNELITHCNGAYIARMDSDDISFSYRFQVQLDFLKNNENIDICSTYAKNFGEKTGYNTTLYFDSIGVKAQLFLYNVLVHPSVMIRKKFIDDNTIRYNEDFKYSQDYELWTRCSKISNLYVIPKVCLKYRFHQKQISTAKLKEQNDFCKEIYKENLNNLDLNENYIKYLLYLSGRIKSNINIKDLEEKIKEILLKNKEKNFYNQKILRKILYLKLIGLKRENNYFISVRDIFQADLFGYCLRKLSLKFKMKIKRV